MSALNFVPEEVLARAEKSNGDIFSILVTNDNTGQELNYIPPTIQACGIDADGNIVPILMNDNREIFK